MATNKRKETFVSKIVKDPANPPKTILLTGYLGASSEAGHTRLYFDAQLNTYVDIPDDAILHEEEISSTPPGQTYVWIKQDAQVIHGEATPQRTKSSFFEGPIAAAAALAPRTLHHGCPITVDQVCFVARTANLTCPTLGGACEVPTEFCPPPRTPLRGCPVTSQFQVCMTPVVPCEVESLRCPPPRTTPQAGCPVTSPFQVCMTPVVPCEVESFRCPPRTTPQAGCPVTSPFQVCMTPVVPCEVESFRCPPRTTPQAGCPVTGPFHVCMTPVAPCELETARCPVASAFCFPQTQIGCPVTLFCGGR